MNLEFCTWIPTRLSVRVASRDATRVNWWEISRIGSPDILQDVNNMFTNHLRGHLYVTFAEVTPNSAIAKLARRWCFVVPRSFLTNCAKFTREKNALLGGVWGDIWYSRYFVTKKQWQQKLCIVLLLSIRFCL